jgi:hypothetical protein
MDKTPPSGGVLFYEKNIAFIIVFPLFLWREHSSSLLSGKNGFEKKRKYDMISEKQ